jgi:uncharacterized membrane protein
METIENSVLIDSPLEHSYEVFMNDENMPKWLKGFKSAELISGEKGAVGSTYKMLFEEGGKELEFTEEVIGITDNESYEFSMSSEMFESRTKVSFAVEDGKTRLTSRSELTPKGMMMKMVMPMMKGEIAKRQEADYERLKELIESTPTSS